MPTKRRRDDTWKKLNYLDEQGQQIYQLDYLDQFTALCNKQFESKYRITFYNIDKQQLSINELDSFNFNHKTITPPHFSEVWFATQDLNNVQLVVDINDLNAIPKQDKDFIVTPILKDDHFVTGIVHFKDGSQQPPNDRDIYVFDSHQQDSRPHIQQEIPNCQLLNTENLQGNSNACGYFTIEFIKESSKCQNFAELQQKCQNHEMQQTVYKNVKRLFKTYNHNLDELIGQDHSYTLEEAGFGTGKKQLLEQRPFTPNWLKLLENIKTTDNIIKLTDLPYVKVRRSQSLGK